MKGIKDRPKVWVKAQSEDDAVFVYCLKEDKAVYVPTDGVKLFPAVSKFGRPTQRAIASGRLLREHGKNVVVLLAGGNEVHVRPDSIVDPDVPDERFEVPTPVVTGADATPGTAA